MLGFSLLNAAFYKRNAALTKCFAGITISQHIPPQGRQGVLVL
jgi:hypothetical protein